MLEGTLQIGSWSGNKISIDPAKIFANTELNNLIGLKIFYLT